MTYGRDAVRRRRLFAVALFAGVALVAFASGAAVVVASQGSNRATTAAAATVNISCPSPALSGQLPALVTLPAGYGNSSAHFPVVYFLHGLPAGPNSYQSNSFVASALAGSGRRAIVVQPQGARSPGEDREYLDWDAGENWPRAISHDLVKCIDSRYRTVRSRFGRALMGVSAGGYGAFNIGLRTLSSFGAVESWSGYFAATDPSGTHILNLGSAKANSDATVPSGSGLKQEQSTWPSLIAFYVGAQDARFVGMNKQFDAELTRSGVTHTFRVYSGGHSTALWRAQAPAWLGMALDAMSSESKHRGAAAKRR